jgi:serine/threonine protein kinase
VAVKVVRSIDRYLDSALIEADLLNDIYEKQRELRKNCCVKMFSQFRWNDHVCMVFETLGSSLYDIIKKNEYKGLPLFMVRDISRQLLQAMSFLKSVNLIHTDLKLENVLFVHSAQRNYEVIHDGQTHTISAPEKTRIKLIDFGGATYDNDPHKSRMVNTRQYRGPEVTLEVGWSFPSDLWSVGCIIGEIYRGDLFFQTHEELEHLALIEKLCGPFPSQLLEKCSFRSKYFDRNGRVRFGELPRDSKEFVRDAKSFQEFFSLQPNDVESGIVSLVEGLLQIDPMQRFSADEALATSSFLFPASTEHSNHGSDTNNYNRNHSSATVTTTSST